MTCPIPPRREQTGLPGLLVIARPISRSLRVASLVAGLAAGMASALIVFWDDDALRPAKLLFGARAAMPDSMHDMSRQEVTAALVLASDLDMLARAGDLPALSRGGSLIGAAFDEGVFTLELDTGDARLSDMGEIGKRRIAVNGAIIGCADYDGFSPGDHAIMRVVLSDATGGMAARHFRPGICRLASFREESPK